MSTRAFCPADDARQRLAEDRLYRFHGGLRLRHNKKISCELPVSAVPLPERLFVPLQQQAGPEARANVDVGQQVLKGEVIGCFRHLGAGCLHAPTSGTVEAITDHPASQASGRDGRCIVIRADGRDAWRPREPIGDWCAAEPRDLRNRIAGCGIVGLGGAAFPMHVKLRPPKDQPIEVLIVNGCECEPYLTSDHRTMLEHPDDVHMGIRIVLRALGINRAVIGIEANKPDAIEVMEKFAGDDITFDRGLRHRSRQRCDVRGNVGNRHTVGQRHRHGRVGRRVCLRRQLSPTG